MPGAFELSTNATVHSPPTILIHFRLLSLRRQAHFSVINDVLADYFSNNKLKVIDIPFNINSTEDTDKWNKDANHLVQSLSLSQWHHMVVFITDHSDPDSGDLWLGVDEEGNSGSKEVGDVSVSLSYYFVLTINYEHNSE